MCGFVVIEYDEVMTFLPDEEENYKVSSWTMSSSLNPFLFFLFPNTSLRGTPSPVKAVLVPFGLHAWFWAPLKGKTLKSRPHTSESLPVHHVEQNVSAVKRASG